MIYKSQTISNWDKLPVALDLHTVALIFDVTDTTVKNWLYRGTIKGTKIAANVTFFHFYILLLMFNEL